MAASPCCYQLCCARSDRCCLGRCGKLRGLAIRRPGVGVVFWIAFVLLTAGVFTGFGLIVSLSVDNRSTNVNAVNAAIATWPASASAFRGLVVNVTGDGGLLVLPASAAADSYPDADGLHLPIADNIHYAATSPAGVPIASRSFNADEKTSVIVSINGTLTTIDNIPLFRVERSNKKTTYKRLSSLCFTVNAQRVVDGGCAKDDGWISNAWQDCDPNIAASFKIAIDVRSIDDPFVKAMRVTAGTLFFGVSQRDKAIIGGVLFGVCCFLFLSMCGSMTGPPAPPWNAADIPQPHVTPQPQTVYLQSHYGAPQYGVQQYEMGAAYPSGPPAYPMGPQYDPVSQPRRYYSADKNP